VARPVSPVPVKPDPLLSACSQQSQFHPKQLSWIHHYQWSQFHPYLQSRIHRYQLAPSNAAFNPLRKARSNTASLHPAMPHCKRGNSEHVRAVRPSMSELQKGVCQRCKSEHVRVVGASLLESWKSEYIHVHVRVVQPSMSELKVCMYRCERRCQ